MREVTVADQEGDAVSDTITVPTTAVPRELSPEERKATLAHAVAAQVRDGWHVQSQTDYQAVFGKGKNTSHGVHIFASIITLGLWLPVWAVMVYVNRDQHRVVNVDPYGNVNVEK